MMTFKSKLPILVALLFMLGVGLATSPLAVEAQDLTEKLSGLLAKHERLMAAKEDVTASQRALEESKGDWLPTLDLTANVGTEVQKKPNADDTNKGIRNVELSASQLLYDFGKTGASIDTAKLTLRQSRLTLESTRQGLILEASQAYINLLTSIQSLGFAKQSADNIRKQTGMEQSRVERGSGFSSDVLQVKAQLAGAQANLVRSQGAVRNAMDRYRTVFRAQNIDVKKLKKPEVPYGLLPKDLKSAIETAKNKSISLKLAKISVLTAKQDIRTKRSAFAPKLEAKGDYKSKHNDGGVLGPKDVTIGKIEMTWPLLAGGKDVSAYRKSFNSFSAAEKRYADARYATVEQVRNSWQNLETSRLNAGFLRNQANISGEFLDLARKERKLGTRTLLDVLSGETSFISSISAAVAAEAARDLAVYNLLFAMGELSLASVELEQETSTKEKPPKPRFPKGR